MLRETKKATVKEDLYAVAFANELTIYYHLGQEIKPTNYRICKIVWLS